MATRNLNNEVLAILKGLVNDNQDDIKKILGTTNAFNNFANTGTDPNILVNDGINTKPNQKSKASKPSKVEKQLDEIAITDANKDILGSWS